jgi:hypothetical protein
LPGECFAESIQISLYMGGVYPKIEELSSEKLAEFAVNLEIVA